MRHHNFTRHFVVASVDMGGQNDSIDREDVLVVFPQSL
jgi:hypothetical protein